MRRISFVEEQEPSIPIGQDWPTVSFCDGVKPQQRSIVSRNVRRRPRAWGAHGADGTRWGQRTRLHCVRSGHRAVRSRQSFTSSEGPARVFSAQRKAGRSRRAWVSNSAFAAHAIYQSLPAGATAADRRKTTQKLETCGSIERSNPVAVSSVITLPRKWRSQTQICADLFGSSLRRAVKGRARPIRHALRGGRRDGGDWAGVSGFLRLSASHGKANGLAETDSSVLWQQEGLERRRELHPISSRSAVRRRGRIRLIG